jgi:hypothetical protein
MYGYVLQDWITVRGGAIPGDIIQGESAWMGFSSFQDMVFWLDVREVTPTSAGYSLTWYFETAPSKDNNLFQAMANVAITTNALTPGLQSSSNLPKVLLAAGPSVPLATWVRWRLSPSGTTTTWDATFRILLSANRVVREVPQQPSW